MVWGAISIHGTSRLCIVEGTMNAKKYIEVLSTRLKPQIHEWFGGSQCIFQQDSAPCHTTKKVHDWMKNNGVKLLPWPDNSPDMNPIESLWDVLKDEIHEVPITNKIQRQRWSNKVLTSSSFSFHEPMSTKHVFTVLKCY